MLRIAFADTLGKLVASALPKDDVIDSFLGQSIQKELLQRCKSWYLTN
jgi:hypothetical protein